jgi:phage N-6-adenine-methyltransferase
MLSPALFSSVKEDWGTPRALFDNLDKVHRFYLDVASSKENALCEEFLTEEDDGLIADWECPEGRAWWCNPPYGRYATGAWVAKAAEEAAKGHYGVMLLPARTDTKWYHKYVEPVRLAFPKAVTFVKGRLHFTVNGKPSKDAAPFPSMVVVMR